MRATYASRASIALGTALLASCAPAEVPETCADLEQRQVNVVRTLTFETAVEGVTQGFNLDDSIGPTEECRGRDYTDPNGVEGVDNQLTLLIPALESMVGESTFSSLIQASINNGQLLVAVVIEGVDDPMNDDCVQVSVTSLDGTPLIGTDNFLLSGQTLDAELDAPNSRSAGAAIHDGMLETEPFELALPVSVLDANFVLDLHAARVRLELAEDGTMFGVIGGSLDNAQVAEIASGLNIPSELLNAVESFAASISDMGPKVDGDCQRFSAAITISTIPVFVRE